MKSIKPLPLLVSAGLLAGPAISKELIMIRDAADSTTHSAQHCGLPATDKNLRHKNAN